MKILYPATIPYTWPTLGDYRALDTYVPPRMADFSDPEALLAEAKDFGFRLKGIAPEQIGDADPSLVSFALAEAAVAVQQGHVSRALDPAWLYRNKTPAEQEIWDAVVVERRPLYLPVNIPRLFTDTISFMPVLRVVGGAAGKGWALRMGVAAEEVGLSCTVWENTTVSGPTMVCALRSGVTWYEARRQDELNLISDLFGGLATTRLAYTWASPGLNARIASVPLFANGVKDQVALADRLSGPVYGVRYGVRSLGGQVFIGVFEFPEGRLQARAPEYDLPLIEEGGDQEGLTRFGISGSLFQFPFLARNSWWARLSVWSVAEAWSMDISSGN